MRKELPDEIKDAVELLKGLERQPFHRLRAEDFDQAIEALNYYLSQNPGSTHNNVIENVKLTYTRWLLEQLAKDDSLSFSEWLPYMMPLLFTAKKEIDIVIKQFPNLGENYKNFLRIWKDELIKREEELEEDDDDDA